MIEHIHVFQLVTTSKSVHVNETITNYYSRFQNKFRPIST